MVTQTEMNVQAWSLHSDIYIRNDNLVFGHRKMAITDSFVEKVAQDFAPKDKNRSR